jgi:hypothetical protein
MGEDASPDVIQTDQQSLHNLNSKFLSLPDELQDIAETQISNEQASTQFMIAATDVGINVESYSLTINPRSSSLQPFAIRI